VSEAPVSPVDATARIAALEALLARANAALAARDLLIDSLRGQIARLRRMQFGASSEKLGCEIEQLELALEELEAERDAAPVAERPSETVSRPAPVRSLPAHLPREEVVHEPASGACTCPDCGGALRRLGVDAHEMLDVVPVRWRVVRDVRPKYSCRVCDKIVQAPAPASAVARGKASFATLAHVVVSKFEHHLPLYRQAEMMAAQGLDIDRSTLAGWAGQAAALLDPVVARIRDEVLNADKIHADDTRVPVLDPGRGKTATGRLWVYAADDHASSSTAPRATWYRFTPDRTARAPAGASRRLSRIPPGRRLCRL
jgi:transposase